MIRIRPFLLVLVLGSAAACTDPLGVHPDAAELELIPTDTLVLEGAVVTLRLRILDPAGDPVEPLTGGEQPRWRTEAPTILAALEPGRFEAVGPGSATVVVEYGDLTASAVVRVNPETIAVTVGAAYVVQVVQRREGDVPLVAGRPGVVRVFPVADRANFFRAAARITLYDGVTAVHSVTLPGPAAGIPVDVDEALRAYEATVPTELIRPGLGLVVEMDPEGILPKSGPVRYPATGVLPLDVRETPPLLLRIVPIRAEAHQTTGRTTTSSAPDFTELMRDIFPAAELQVDVAPVYSTDARLDTHEGWSQLLRELYQMQLADPQPRYYYGAVQIPAGAFTRGLSYGTGTRTAAGSDVDPAILAHEIGHTFGLGHTPGCSAAFDQNYPYPNGAIGQWGFNVRTGTPVAPDTRDFMGCAGIPWISDYHYEKTLAFRSEHD